MSRLRSTWLGSALAITFVAAGVHAQTKGGAAAAPPAKSGTTSAPAEAPPEDPVRKLFDEGTADLAASRFAEAEQKLRAAWAQKNAYDIAGNLGATLHNLGKHVEAARFLAYAADNFPVGGKPSVRKWLDETLADTVKEIVTVHVKVSVDGAQVKVNGAEAGTSPLADRTFAAAGAIVIEAHKEGFEDARVELKGDKGGTVDANVTMKPKSNPTPQRSMLLPAIAFGVGGAGLVVGAITGGVSAAKLADLKTACGGDFTCAPAYRSEAETGRAVGHVSTAAFIVAGLGAAAGVTLLLVPIGQPAPAHATLTMGPGYLGVKGTF